MKVKCTICGLVAHARGLCRKHWDADRGHVPWHVANPAKQRARVYRWRAAKPEAIRASNRQHHARNKLKRNMAARIYRAQHLEHMRALGREWSKNNPAKWRVTNAERRAAKVRATTSTAKTEFEELVISEMYDLAARRTKATNMPWHVDHIVPLRSKIVCGLHCSANLRVIPGIENHRKGNRYWPNMP